jgi:paired amphipathic helix protein Sin3a
MRKNKFEEMLFRCEDDRFELDLVIECNLNIIKVLESIMKQISELNEEETARFRLDTSLDSKLESNYIPFIYFFSTPH